MIGRLRLTLSRLFFLRRQDMTTVTFMRPTGTTLTVNDSPDTRALAAANGWTVVGEKPEKPEKAVKKEKPAK
jgi:hypothetical protein